MKLKELKRTVNVCWSPAEHHPVMLAAGSAAQQVDASFSSSSYLELYSLNLEDSGQDLELKSSLQTEHKFQKVVWSGANIIVGGCDGGLLQFYSVEKLLSKASDSLLGSNTKHSGHVSALDINPYQKNLLASGASDSEIFIWDLNNTSQPMAPGNRSQPHDHVQGLAWNQQVQHILGSTFSSRCVVWDLRKNEPIMKLSDSQSRTRWRSLAWHPSVATQLCIASEEDQVPVIQLWDLRLAASPLATLEGHHKGVMALSWCKQDPDLLLSAGKDGRVLCWNPNDTRPGGLPAELSQQGQWVFDVQWAPRCPALLVSTSFDHQLTVHSLFGGSRAESSPQSASNIMDSFGGADSFSQLPAVPRAHAPPPPRPHQLPRPPSWLKRPSGAKFAFGGKLVTFDRCPQEAGAQKHVYISQVVSEPEMVEKAAELEEVLQHALGAAPDAADRLAEYCLQRGAAAADQQERYTWFFLRASFVPQFRSEALNLLGFKQDDIPSKFKSQNVGEGTQVETAGLSRGESTETEAELSTDTSTDLSDGQTLIERKLAAVELEGTASDVVIPEGEDAAGTICRALVCGNLEEAVELCLRAERVADALCIACLGSQELVYKVQKYHLTRTAQDPVSLLSHSMLDSRWDTLVNGARAAGWRQVLAALLTHCEGEALAHYCEMLGDRLSRESDPKLSEAAEVCYLVGMVPEPLVVRWNRTRVPTDVEALARLTTLALVARSAAAHRGREIQAGGSLEAVLEEWAGRLAAQGCLRAALRSLHAVRRAALRDTLAAALARTDSAPQVQPTQSSGRARTVSTHSQKRGHLVHNDAHNSFGAVPPTFDQQWGQSSVAAPSFQQRGFQSNQPPQSLPPQPLPPQPLQPQPLQPQPLQSQPPLTQPPRPGSVGSQSGGITSRSKYKVDPSVQSPHYSQYSYNNPVTSQPSYGYNSPVPDQYHNSSVNNFAPINPMNSGLNQPNPGLNPLNPGLNSMNPGLNSMNPGLNSMNPGLNSMNPGLNSMNPALNPANPGLNPVNPGVPPATPSLNGGHYEASKPAAPPGWNDPPMVTNKPKREGMSATHAGTRRWGRAIDHRRGHEVHEPKQEVVNQAPITHPLFGTEPPQTVPLNPAQYPGQQQYPGQPQQYPGQQQQYPGQQQQYPGQQQQYPAQQYPGQYDQQYQQGAPPGYTQQAQEAVAPAPAPAQKAPLPSEHAHLHSVLDSLRTRCAERATNPQMKRKLEDIQRRLETMYDMLREYKLSETALQALHQCASSAAARDYAAALDACTSLAGGADFASAASFLPALKGLLQLAHQLNVYVA